MIIFVTKYALIVVIMFCTMICFCRYVISDELKIWILHSTIIELEERLFHSPEMIKILPIFFLTPER